MPNHDGLSATALLALFVILTGCGGGGGGEVANPFSPPGTTQPPASDGAESPPVDDDGGSPAGSDKLTLKWNPNPAANWYEVYFGRTADRTKMQLLAKPDESSADFDILTDLSALPGEEVCFRVKAFNNVAESGFSDAVCTII